MGIPFSIQALTFDINNKKLIAKEGIEALKMRKFKVHNVQSAKEIAKRMNVSINERIMKKLRVWDFK